MFGIYLFIIAQIAFALPIALGAISERLCVFICKNAEWFRVYFLATLTAGFISIVIMIVQGIGLLLNWLF